MQEAIETERYVRHHRRQIRRRRAACERLAAELRARLPAVVEALHAIGAREVVLFGSLARGRFRPDSDVDLALGGLPRGRMVEAMVAAERILRRPVDIVRLETAGEWLRARIEAEGERLGDA